MCLVEKQLQKPQRRKGFNSIPGVSLKLNHLRFADDLMVFTSVDVNSIRIVEDVLEELKEMSGLQEIGSKVYQMKLKLRFYLF